MTNNASTMPAPAEAGSRRDRPAVRRWRRLLALTTVAGLATIGLAASPSQASTTTCDGNISNVIIPGSVEVPAGAACNMSRVLVIGSVDVRDGADLFLTETGVTGKLNIHNDAFGYVIDTTITSGTRLLDAFGMVAENSTLTNGVDVQGAVLFFSEESNHAGAVTSNAGWTFIESGQIAGGVFTVQDASTDLVDTTVAGHVTVDQASNGSIVCQSTISGDVSVTGSGGVIQFGGDQPQPECGSNVLTGGLEINNNTASQIRVSSNLIIGGLACQDNTSAPSGSDNLVIGPSSGQCASLEPDPAGMQTLMTTPDSRRAEIWELVSERIS